MPEESWWRRMLAWIKRQYEIPVHAPPPEAPPTLPNCAFCEARPVQYESSVPCLYPLWKCQCGAIGSGALLPDLDEVGDQLLEIFGIGARVSLPCEPTDHPAISIQRYDVNKVEQDMAELLKLHGCEFRISFRNSNERQFWVKREQPQS